MSLRKDSLSVDSPEKYDALASIAAIRTEIGADNVEIFSHISAIGRIVRERRLRTDAIGHIKAEHGLEIVDPAHEQVIHDDLTTRCLADGTPIELGLGIMGIIIEDSVKRQLDISATYNNTGLNGASQT